MYFYDLKDHEYPIDAQYYFNILLVNIAVCPQLWEQQEREIWDISRVNNSKPVAFHIYVDREMAPDEDWSIECQPHTVIEVRSSTNEISWYYMLNSDDYHDIWEI